MIQECVYWKKVVLCANLSSIIETEDDCTNVKDTIRCRQFIIVEVWVLLTFLLWDKNVTLFINTFAKVIYTWFVIKEIIYVISMWILDRTLGTDHLRKLTTYNTFLKLILYQMHLLRWIWNFTCFNIWMRKLSRLQRDGSIIDLCCLSLSNVCNDTNFNIQFYGKWQWLYKS